MDGNTVHFVKEQIVTICPAEYCVEQNAADIWQTVVKVLRKTQEISTGYKIRSVGVSGAMQSLLPLDYENTPITNAWIWSDFRAQNEADILRENSESRMYYQITGCPIQPVYHPSRILHIKKNASSIFSATQKWVGIKDFIIYKLTGTLATDCGMASSTGLLDILKVTWFVPLLEEIGISRVKLPDLLQPTDSSGTISPEVALLTGLQAGMPVVTGSTDGVLASYGAGAAEQGGTIISVATGLAVRIWSNKPWLDPLERSWCYLFTSGDFVIGGAGNNGGSAIRWVREQFYKDVSEDIAYQQIFIDAAEVTAGAEGLRVEPYFNGTRTPRWRADLCASITGIKSHHSRKQISRAVIEGIGREVKEIWDVVKASGKIREPVVLSGPFCSQPVWIEELQAKLDIEVLPRDLPDASAIGAAKLALNYL